MRPDLVVESTMQAEMMECSQCGESKPTSEFPRPIKRRAHWHDYCRRCRHRERSSEYNAANRDKLKAYREKRIASGAHAEYQREWRKKNPESFAASMAKVSCEQRKLIAWVNHQNFRTGGGVDDDARDYVRVLHRDPCSYCGGPAGEIDHISPTSTGGANEWDNLTAACRRCNASKGSNRLLEFFSDAA